MKNCEAPGTETIRDDIRPPVKDSATSIAAAVFPEAVGPTRVTESAKRTNFGLSEEFAAIPKWATQYGLLNMGYSMEIRENSPQ